MNQKTARLLRKAQVMTDGHSGNYRRAKRAWNATPRRNRAVWRRMAILLINNPDNATRS